MTKEVFKDFSYGVLPFRKIDHGLQVYIVRQRNGNHWGFPKGHKEGDETSYEAAVRELKEETGLQIEQLLTDKTFCESFSFVHKGQPIFKTVEYYVALVRESPVLQPEEILDGKWVDIHTVMHNLTYDEAKNVFKLALHELQMNGVV